MIALSVAEAEHYAFAKGAAMVLGLQSSLQETGFELEAAVDVKSSTAKSLGYHFGVDRTKHMSTRWLWTQEFAQRGNLMTFKVNGKTILSDVLTKAIGRPTLDAHTTRIGTVSIGEARE